MMLPIRMMVIVGLVFATPLGAEAVCSSLTNNTAGWYDPAAYGASFSTATFSGTTTSGSSVVSIPSTDFQFGQGVFIPNGGAACSIASCSSLTPTAPTVTYGTCASVNQASPYSAASWTNDIGVFFARNMEPFENVASGPGDRQYSVSAGSYSFPNDQNTPLTICWGTSTTAGTHSIAVKVAALDGAGGMSKASAATTVSSAALLFPTATHPVRIVEGTPVTGAAGYAFWESIDGGAYFLAHIVWTNESHIDQGTALQGATPGYYGFVEWGESAATAEDIPQTPPAASLNDDLLTTVTNMTGTTVTGLAANAGVSTGSATLAHDDAPAWNALMTACAGTPNTGCKIQVRAGTSRISSLTLNTSVNDYLIAGQDPNTSILQFFGQGGAYCAGNPQVGGEFKDPGGGVYNPGLTLEHIGITSTNTAAECLMNWEKATGVEFSKLQINDANITGPTSSYLNRGLVFQLGGGNIAATMGGFNKDIQLGNDVNGFLVGQAYTSFNQVWPGILLNGAIEYFCGMENVTIDTPVFENSWNAIRPTGGGPATSCEGGYISGFKLINAYNSDTEAVTNTAVANGITGSSVNPTGTGVTLNGTNMTVESNSGWFSNAGTPFSGLGCIWAQDFVAGNTVFAKNNGGSCGAFGVLANGGVELDEEDNTFPGTNSVVSGLHSGSRSAGNSGDPMFMSAETTVSGLTCDSSHRGWSQVSDSTTVATEGQTCVGSSTHHAAVFCDGSTKKCF